jgi:hypothetical protein
MWVKGKMKSGKGLTEANVWFLVPPAIAIGVAKVLHQT